MNTTKEELYSKLNNIWNEYVDYGCNGPSMNAEIENLINQEVLQALGEVKIRLDDLPHISYKGGYQIPYEEIEATIEQIEEKYR